MKTRLIAVFLVLVLTSGLAACGEFAALEPAVEFLQAGKEENTIVIPEAVLKLSEEDEILLNGELKDGVYINRYFGIKLSVPEGWTLTRLNDDATESTEMIPMRQVYEEEMNGLFFTASSDSFKGYIDVYITALKDGERGLNEEELIRKNIEDMWEINRLFGDDEGPEYATAMLVGEEHPVSVSVSESEAGEQLFAVFAIPKGDFKYEISISAANARLEDLTGFFEKI